MSCWNDPRVERAAHAGGAFSAVDLYIRRAWYEGCDFVTPRFYRRSILPRLKAEVDLAHDHGAKFGYICSSGTDADARFYLEAGIDVLIGIDPVQGTHTNLPLMKEKLGKRTCLWGGVSAAVTLERGSEEDSVRPYAMPCKPWVLRDYPLSPVDNVTIDGPQTWKNIQTFINEWRQHRTLNLKSILKMQPQKSCPKPPWPTCPKSCAWGANGRLDRADARAGQSHALPVCPARHDDPIPHRQRQNRRLPAADARNGQPDASAAPRLWCWCRRASWPTRWPAEAETPGHATGVRSMAVYGGVGYGEQLAAFKAGAHLVIGTPGRVLDHLLRRSMSLEDLKFLVFDEADRMLSMGFYPDMRRVQSYLPERRVSTFMFSATFPPQVIRLAANSCTSRVFST